MTNNITDVLRDQLKAAIKAEGLSFSDLSLKVSDDIMYVSKTLSPAVAHSPKLSTMAKIAEAAGLEIEVKVVKKGTRQ